MIDIITSIDFHHHVRKSFHIIAGACRVKSYMRTASHQIKAMGISYVSYYSQMHVRMPIKIAIIYSSFIRSRNFKRVSIYTFNQLQVNILSMC